MKIKVELVFNLFYDKFMIDSVIIDLLVLSLLLAVNARLFFMTRGQQDAAVLLAPVCIFVYAEHANIHFVTGALLILGCYDGDSWLNKLLDRKLFRHCGKLSLSIYVNHALICRITQGFLFHRLEAWGILTGKSEQTLFYLVLLTLYSIATMTIIEAWCRRKKKNV